MLGRALQSALYGKFHTFLADISRSEASSEKTDSPPVRFYTDIAQPDLVKEAFRSSRPDWVIHCAARTDVDGCESDPAGAMRVNRNGTENIAASCAAFGARMVLISTDYVFHGNPGRPWRETDSPNPRSVYARSKYEAEIAAKKILNDLLIVRTAWVYGPGGGNFVRSILNQGRKGGELRVVADQYGSPTYAPDLAEAIGRLIDVGAAGIVHCVNSGVAGRHDFAKAILDFADMDSPVRTIASTESNRPAVRPPYSVLSCDRYFGFTGHRIRHWREALAACVKGGSC